MSIILGQIFFTNGSYYGTEGVFTKTKAKTKLQEKNQNMLANKDGHRSSRSSEAYDPTYLNIDLI